MYLYKPSDKSTSESVDFWYMADVSKEENRSPRPGNRRGRHDNNQNEPSSGKLISWKSVILLGNLLINANVLVQFKLSIY